MGISREEFAKIVKVLKAVYTDIIPDKAAFDVWYFVLSDLDNKMLQGAALRYIQSNHFPPTPHDLRKMALVPAQEETDGEAWAKARRAIADSTYHSTERFAELPPRIQAVFRSPEALREWGSSKNSNEDVMRSNFLRLYSNAKEVRQKQEIISPKVQALISQATEAISMINLLE